MEKISLTAVSIFSLSIKFGYVYYITVVAFENKVPLSQFDLLQDNPLVKISQLSGTAYESVVDLRCQQFCKDPLIFLNPIRTGGGVFYQVQGFFANNFGSNNAIHSKRSDFS